jgi:hypothetical protein
MKLSEKLLILAAWLQETDNELLVDAESNEEHMAVVADALICCADICKTAANVVEKTEEDAPVFTAAKLDEMAAVAKAFDESGDELLEKQASVLDDILLTIAAPKNFRFNFKQAEDNRIDELKKKYQEIKPIIDDINKISDATKTIKDSAIYANPVESKVSKESLSTRYCMEHHGFSMIRVGENEYQCPVDHKVFNFQTGFTLNNGKMVAPAGVEYQSRYMLDHSPGHAIFDTRAQRLGQNSE